ncbi:hypothetical protein [Nocardioides deserti]|uniref:hypothetical protein n=1 Tax=Nocardioides deserti TaxID=1588644 RepID=UPI001E2A33EC|nr:hypothetical protein [Nocardioides deserti]
MERGRKPIIDGHGRDWAEDDIFSRPLQGDHLRLMAEYVCPMPLWDADGDLPDDLVWLQTYLGLSAELIEDLRS